MARCAACGAAPPADARFCPACGAPLARRDEERKLATVLFADLVGSTSLASDVDPERTRALLERFYEAMALEIEAAGGTLEKFVGDSVQAAFGAPAAQEDHAERALDAALSMQGRLHELFDGTLRLRIGVNTGEIVVGEAWAGGSWLTGDAVNVGKRLEQAAAPGEILVGERAASAAGGAFEFGPPRTVEAKGKPGGVPARPLLCAVGPSQPRDDRSSEFVGREAELEVIEATYRRSVRESTPHLITLLGDAGVGKSALVRHQCERLATTDPEPRRLGGRCLSYGRGITYFALGEVLRQHLGLLQSDPPALVVQRLAGRSALAPTLGLESDPDLHPLTVRERLDAAWVDLLSELAAARPTVLFIEDLHWAEEPLLDLLEGVLRGVQGSLLVLVTARPELLDRRPGWGARGRNAATLWIEPLPPAEGELLVDRLAGDALPGDVRRAIAARAEGNPFFAEELVAAFTEVSSGVEVPDTVQAVVSARVDQLPVPEKAALQAAAVIGRVFWKGPVCELVDGADPNFALLEERDFIRRRHSSGIENEEEWGIKHALTLEVAYASIPKARRACLHAAFARWLERKGGGRDEHAALLAHHYAEAVRPEDADLAWRDDERERERSRAKAVEWLRRAAELAVARYEIDDTVALLRRAVELEPDQRIQPVLWREIGRAFALKYDGPAFWDAMERSLAVCVDQAVCAQTYGELAFQTTIRSGMWKRQPEREEVEHWIACALELAEPESPVRVLALLARAHWCAGADEDAACEASALAERLGDVDLRSYAFGARGIAAFHGGRFQEAATWTERRLELAPGVTDPDHVVEIYESAIPAVTALGRWREAHRLAEAHSKAALLLSPHHRLHSIALTLEIEEAAGGWDRIHELIGSVEEAVAENAATPCIRNARSLLLCAIADACVGDERRTPELLRAAEDTGIVASSLSSPRLRLALLRGDFETTRRLLEEDERVYYAVGPGQIATRLDALAALGERDRIEIEATELLHPGTYVEPFALRALGIARGDESLVAQALERFRGLDLGWHAAQTDQLLAAGRSR